MFNNTNKKTIRHIWNQTKDLSTASPHLQFNDPSRQLKTKP
jgi:hypothetical protein